MTATNPNGADAALAHVELVIRSLGLDAAQAEALRTPHRVAMRISKDGAIAYVDTHGTPMLDLDRGYAPLDTAGWLRSFAKSRPDLLPNKQADKAQHAAATKVSSASKFNNKHSVSPGTLSAEMAEAKRNPMKLAELRARFKID